MKKLLLIGLLLMSCGSFSQNSNSRHSLGGFAGSDTGMGFSYRYWYKKFGIQVSGVPIFKKDNEHFITAGISFLYELKQGKHVDLYTYIGYHYINRKSTLHYIDPYTGNDIKNNILEEYHNNGIGLGFKFKLLDELSFNLQGGYGFYNVTGQLNYNFAGGIGLYYNL